MSPTQDRCGRPNSLIGLAYATEALAVCPNSGRLSSILPERPSSTPPPSLAAVDYSQNVSAGAIPNSRWRKAASSDANSAIATVCHNFYCAGHVRTHLRRTREVRYEVRNEKKRDNQSTSVAGRFPAQVHRNRQRGGGGVHVCAAACAGGSRI